MTQTETIAEQRIECLFGDDDTLTAAELRRRQAGPIMDEEDEAARWKFHADQYRAICEHNVQEIERLRSENNRLEAVNMLTLAACRELVHGASMPAIALASQAISLADAYATLNSTKP